MKVVYFCDWCGAESGRLKPNGTLPPGWWLGTGDILVCSVECLDRKDQAAAAARLRDGVKWERIRRQGSQP